MFVVNKNISHNGKDYLNGSEIKKGDAGFDELVKAGHAVEVSGSSKAQAEPVPEDHEDAPEFPDDEEKPKKKKR